MFLFHLLDIPRKMMKKWQNKNKNKNGEKDNTKLKEKRTSKD